MLNICLVEDNEKLGNLLHKELLDAWYASDRYTSVESIDLAKSMRYHIFVLDIMLPWQDGISFAEQLRGHSKVGIILLTAKSTFDAKKEGFEAWVDDYLTKPFKTKELCMRIDALAQRLETSHYYKLDDIFIDRKNRLAKKWDKMVHLTPTEREVMGCLVRNNWLLCQRVDIIEHVWWTDELFWMNRSLDVTIAHIRKKLWQECVETVPWVWYKLW